MIKRSIYVLVPNEHRLGGVYNYYSHVKPYLGNHFKYLYRGEKTNTEPRFVIPFRMVLDYFAFLKTIVRDQGAVVINSSLGPGSFFRDGLYSLITPKRYKTISYFHGWNPEFEKKIDKSWLLKKWLERTFLKADHIIVLSSEFKKKLIEWGYKGPISLETTLVDEQLLEGEFWESIAEPRAKQETTNLLYLGNVSKAKGVWEVVESLQKLNGDAYFQNICLNIAGGGKELEALKEHAENSQLNTEFLGYVREEEKAQAFINAHLYVFPSNHGEGMPLSVLEAMAFGLPIITTGVGGIPDFFEEGKMGIFLDNRQPEHIAEKIRYLLDRPELMQEISKYNYEYAKEHFYASKVAKRLEAIIDEVRGKQGPDND